MNADAAEPVVLQANYPDFAALEKDIEQNISQGRMFIQQVHQFGDQRIACIVRVSIVGAAQSVDIPGEIVWTQPEGLGIELEWQDALEQELDVFRTASPNSAGNTPAANPHERVRNLSGAEQQKVAREGTLPERIALERRYGKAVWEALLQNRSLTPPEVAKIARNGTLPKPMLETIAANPTWTNNPEVRRALLSNPRCSRGSLTKILRQMPRHELKLVPQQTAYPPAARNAAKQLLGKK